MFENVTESKYLFPISVLFVVVLMISNTVAVKLVEVGPFVLAGATFIFPISYIFGDVLTEVYGYRATRKVIWLGFFSLLLMSMSYLFVQFLPAASFWGGQAAYESILGFVPRIVAGSIVGFFAGEFCNSYIMSKMKVVMEGRSLWMRTIGSTVVGEGVDTVVFAVVAFFGAVPLAALVTMIWSGYLFKVLIEVLLTPVTYFVVNRLKQAEDVDVYDRNISYNPFRV